MVQTVLRRSPRRGRARIAALAAAAVLLIVLAAAACGDDGGGSDSAPSLPQTTTSAPAKEPTESATAPADITAAEQEIKENWKTFFDPSVSLADKAKVLQDGDRLAPVLGAFSGDQRGQQVSANVTEVAFTSPTEADVTYDLTRNGATALPNAQGTAVLQDEVWKVSAKTFCALVQLSGNANASALPGC
jgi:hypothetical protein